MKALESIEIYKSKSVGGGGIRLGSVADNACGVPHKTQKFWRQGYQGENSNFQVDITKLDGHVTLEEIDVAYCKLGRPNDTNGFAEPKVNLPAVRVLTVRRCSGMLGLDRLHVP